MNHGCQIKKNNKNFLFFFILVGYFSYSLADEPLLLKQNEDEFEDHVGNKLEAEMKSRNDSVSATMEGWLLPQYLISERKEEIMKYVVPKGATIGKIIYKKNNPSFLLCHEHNLKLYKFFGWSSLDISNFKVPDHSKNLKGMIYNFDDFKKDKNTVYNFYYNS